MRDSSNSESARILVPLTLAPISESKLPVAEEQARALDAELILLHVLPPGTLDPDTVTPAEAAARAFLDTAVARLRRAGLRARQLIRDGPIAETIVEVARSLPARLIILGMNVRATLPSILRGSVTDQVIRHAPCPVLLVRPDPAAGVGHPLRSFAEDAARAGPLAPRRLGLRTVQVARIVGSVSKVHELGPDFRPLRPSPAEEQRYQQIRQAFLRGEPLPPVELYKLGFGYYVLDGHHRVAAARELGPDAEIDAIVTEFLPLGDAEAWQAFSARQAFEQATRLTRIGATQPGTYSRLEELIEAYRREQGLPDLRQAARRWYSEVFLPLRRRIRELRLTRQFPGERPADIIARVAGWRRRWEERTGERLPLVEALERFAAELDATTDTALERAP